MRFKDKVVVVSGGVKGIGRCICEMFKKEGAHVCVIDVLDNDYFVGDVASEDVLVEFSKKVIGEYGHIDYLINNAKPLMKGLMDCGYEEFNYALRVGVSAPFMLVKLFKDYFNEGACIINISSTRAYMSQANSESYAASKGGISALTHSMAATLAPCVRVNSISPGWIDTVDSDFEDSDLKQHFVGRVGRVEDIASMVLFLCSDEASFINGEDICIDGGMSKRMIYHNDEGWLLK